MPTPHAPTPRSRAAAATSTALATTAAPRTLAQTRARVLAMIRALLDETAADANPRWGGGRISPSAYEAAWVALVRDPARPDRLAFPQTLEWLLRSQRHDGSWDAPFPYSILPTMAGLLALRRAPDQRAEIVAATDRAWRYLTQTLPRWNATLVDTPFFEFLIPLLAGELARVGVALTIPDLALMDARREAKLGRLPLEMLYSGESNLLHALEVFGATLDFTRLRALRTRNGGYGASPSATAALLLNAPEWDSGAAAWLRHLSMASQAEALGSLPTSHPSDVFEASWVLHLLYHGDVSLEPTTDPAVLRMLRWLHASVTPRGASFSRLGGLPSDADDTALALTVLNRLGVRRSLAPLWRFERADHFVSYYGERTTSTSANAHVLEALLSVDTIGLPALAARRRKAATYLLGERQPEGFWTDKWHLSAYYGTLSSVLALTRMPEASALNELKPTLEWLRETQHGDGGWGMQSATLEETAFGLLTALDLYRADPGTRTETTRGMMRRAYRFVVRHLEEVEAAEMYLPTFWVDKTLYAPPRVIRAAVLAALHRYMSRHPWDADA